MNKDILRYICLKLEPVDLINLTKCEKLSQKLDNNFWVKKLKKDFNIKNVYNFCEENLYKKLYVDTEKTLLIYLNRKYSDKLIEHLIQTGYIENFKKEIFNFLGPLSGGDFSEENQQNFRLFFGNFFEPDFMDDAIVDNLLFDLGLIFYINEID